MAVLIVPFGLACMTFLVYLVLKGRHTERMSIIERGLDASHLNLSVSSKWIVLRIGMLLMAIGLGFFLGFVVESNNPDFAQAVPQITLVLLLGGAALIANFFVEQKWRK